MSRASDGLLALLVALGVWVGSARADEPGRAPDIPVPMPGRAAADKVVDRAPVWDWLEPEFQKGLEEAMHGIGLGPALRARRLAVALVDLTDPTHPRAAAVNGDQMFYAASLPKIAVMLAVFEKISTGEMELDQPLWDELWYMIRPSSNAAATRLMHKVGKEYIAEVLVSDRYRLYDPEHEGGLWAGKDYAKGGLWSRDPVHHLSHGATALQVARFYYLLQTGNLVSPQASRQMKRILKDPPMAHKFVKGIRSIRPQASIYRKGGTWDRYHADGGIVEREGAVYIAVALAESPKGREWLPAIIVAMDGIVGARSERSAGGR